MLEVRASVPSDLGLRHELVSLPISMLGRRMAEPADLKALLLEGGAGPVASRYLIDRVPFVFRDDWELYRQWKRKLSDLIDVDPANLAIVGSAGVGYSLSPNKGFSAFHDKSDIDVAIISDFHFLQSWRALRKVNLGDTVSYSEREAIKDHRQKYVYWGCIAADRVLRFLPFQRAWTEAMSVMAGTAPTEGRDVKFRIYRDYDALRLYSMNTLEELKAELIAK